MSSHPAGKRIRGVPCMRVYRDEIWSHLCRSQVNSPQRVPLGIRRNEFRRSRISPPLPSFPAQVPPPGVPSVPGDADAPAGNLPSLLLSYDSVQVNYRTVSSSQDANEKNRRVPRSGATNFRGDRLDSRAESTLLFSASRKSQCKREDMVTTRMWRSIIDAWRK